MIHKLSTLLGYEIILFDFFSIIELEPEKKKKFWPGGSSKAFSKTVYQTNYSVYEYMRHD